MSKVRQFPQDAAPDFRLRPLPGVIRHALFASAGALAVQGATLEQAQAGPQGGNVAAGQGQINTPNATTTVVQQQSHSLVVNWQTFNVAKNELVQFNQPSASASVLNRVMNQTPSQIFGSVNANGKVFLLNPSGVVIGKGARVNVGSLFMSSLDIADDDFMNGKYQFAKKDGSPAGAIINRGLIQAATGGSVTLVGEQVSNEGVIVADAGHVNLAAGRTATVDFNGDGLIRFEVDGKVLENASGADAAVANSGEIHADGGQVLLTATTASQVFDRAVNNSGLIRAGSIQKVGGKVTLSGLGGGVVNTGTVDASGTRGGEVRMVSDSVIEQFGTARAEGSSGDGGLVHLASIDSTLVGDGSLTSVRSDAGTGGLVEVLGDKVGLFGNARVDASGATGGGTALIGGDYQGTNAEVQNAKRTYVANDVLISASADVAGDGGKVIVWADEVTRFFGKVSARGGSTAGDGGFVEVSGKQGLTFLGDVDIRAANGLAGTLLLDPDFISIIDGAALTGDQDANLSADDTIAFADANSALNTVSVGQINASTGSVTINAGQIDFNNSTNIAMGAGLSISFTADNTADPNSAGGDNTIQNTGANAFSITTTGAGTIDVDAGGLVDLTGITLNSGSTITVNGGGDTTLEVLNATSNINVTSSSGSILAASGGSLLTGAVVTLSAQTDIGVVGGQPLNTAASNLNLTATAGDIAVSQTGAAIIDAATAGDEIVYSQDTGLLTIAGAVTSGASGITIDPPTDVAIDAAIDGGTGAVVIEADNDITFNVGGSIANASTVTLTADMDADSAGAIVDTQATTDIIASGLVTLSAGGGIGSGNTLETSAGALGVTTTATASPIDVTEVDGLTALTVATNDSDVNVSFTAAADSLSFTAATDLLTFVAATTPVTFTTSGGIDLSGASSSTTATLSAGGAITDASAGIVTASLLDTTSVGGTTLNTSTHVLEAFTAMNMTSGAISLRNDSGGGTLNVQAVSQAGGGAVTLTEADAISLSGALSATASTVTLSAGGTITDSVAGVVTAAVLDTTSVGGTTLNTGTHVVEAFTASNTTSGSILLMNNTAGGTLDVQAITQVAGGANAVTLTEADAISLSGALGGADNTVTLSAGGTITDSVAGVVTAAVLDTTSVGGTTLNTGTHVVEAFTASNTTSGSILLMNNTAGGTLDVQAITQVAGGANAVTLTEADAISLSGALGGADNTVTLSAGGTITDSVAGVVTAAVLDTTSVGGTTLNTSTHVLEAFTAMNMTSGAISLMNDSGGGTLNVQAVSQAGGGAVTLTEADAISLSGALSATASTVTLSAGGTITDSVAGVVTAAVLDTTSVSGTTLNTGTHVVEAFTASNTTSGSILLMNNTAGGTLDVQAITQVAGGANAVTLTEADAISLSGALGGADNTVTLSAGGTITDSVAGVVTAAVLDTTSVGGTTLNTGTHVVEAFTASNATSGSILLMNNTAGGTLDVQGITQVAGGTNAVTITESDSISVSSDLNAMDNEASLIASTGSIGGGGSITGSTVNLTASAGIGSRTEAGTLNATNGIGGGNVAIIESSAVQVNSLSNGSVGGTLSLTSSGDIDLNSGISTAGGSAALNSGGNVVNLLTGVAIDTTTNGQAAGGDITLDSAVDGAQTLLLNAGTGGTVNANQDIGGATALSGFTVRGGATNTVRATQANLQAVRTTGGPISVAANTIGLNGAIETTGGATGTLTIDGGGISFNGGSSITVGASNISLLGNNVGAVDLVLSQALSVGTALVLSAPRDILVQAIISSASDITLTADSDADGVGGVQVHLLGEVQSGGVAILEGVSLFDNSEGVSGYSVALDGPGNAADRVSAGSNVILRGTAGSGDIRVSGDVTASSTIAIDAFGSGVTELGDAGNTQITSNAFGNITFSDNVELVGSTTVSTAGDVNFSGTVDGSQALVIDSSFGTTTFTGAVGFATQLASLTTDSGGFTVFDTGFVRVGVLDFGDAFTTFGQVISDDFTSRDSGTLTGDTAFSLDAADIQMDWDTANLTVSFDRRTAGILTLGGAGGLSLTASEIANVTPGPAGTLRFGFETGLVNTGISLAGALDTSATSLGTTSGGLAMRSLGAISGAGAITTSRFGLRGTGGPISVSGTFDVVAVDPQGANTVGINGTGGFDVGTVDGIVGIQTALADVSLTSTGAITQSATIVADKLTVSSVGGVRLDTVANLVSSFTAINTGGGTVGLLDAGGGLIIATPGVTTDGAVIIETPGDLTQDGAGTITGVTLLTATSSGGNVVLGAANSMSGFTGSAAGGVTYNNGVALQLGNISAGTTVAITNAGGIGVGGAVNAAGGTASITDSTADIGGSGSVNGTADVTVAALTGNVSNVTANSSGGAVGVTAGGGAISGVGATGATTVDVTASTSVSGLSAQSGSGTATVAANGGSVASSSVTSTGADIVVTSNSSVSGLTATAATTATVTTNGGPIVGTTVTSPGTLTMNATNGGISATTISGSAMVLTTGGAGGNIAVNDDGFSTSQLTISPGGARVVSLGGSATVDSAAIAGVDADDSVILTGAATVTTNVATGGYNLAFANANAVTLGAAVSSISAGAGDLGFASGVSSPAGTLTLTAGTTNLGGDIAMGAGLPLTINSALNLTSKTQLTTDALSLAGAVTGSDLTILRTTSADVVIGGSDPLFSQANLDQFTAYTGTLSLGGERTVVPGSSANLLGNVEVAGLLKTAGDIFLAGAGDINFDNTAAGVGRVESTKSGGVVSIAALGSASVDESGNITDTGDFNSFANPNRVAVAVGASGTIELLANNQIGSETGRGAKFNLSAPTLSVAQVAEGDALVDNAVFGAVNTESVQEILTAYLASGSAISSFIGTGLRGAVLQNLIQTPSSTPKQEKGELGFIDEGVFLLPSTFTNPERAVLMPILGDPDFPGDQRPEDPDADDEWVAFFEDVVREYIASRYLLGENATSEERAAVEAIVTSELQAIITFYEAVRERERTQMAAAQLDAKEQPKKVDSNPEAEQQQPDAGETDAPVQQGALPVDGQTLGYIGQPWSAGGIGFEIRG